MHIILGFLGAVVTILVLLNRLQEGGIDIGWLNPFSWHRRRKFRQQYDLNPAYSLDSPMDVAALFMLAIAKIDGDITREQKDFILELFQTDFKLSESKAKQLLGASVHILGNADDVKSNPKAVLSRSLDSFSLEQIRSTMELLHKVANLECSPSSEQLNLIDAINTVFNSTNKSQWK